MLKTRVITAIAALAIIAVVLVVLPRLWAEVVIGLLLLVGAWEWSGFLETGRTGVQATFTAIVAGCLVAVHFATPAQAEWILIVASAWWLVAFVWTLRFPTPIPSVVRWISGILVIVPLFLALCMLLRLGVEYLLFILLIVWVADGGAYFAGKAFGRVKLAPAISPGKTWEGVVGGFALVTLLAVAVALWRDVSIGVLVPFCLAVAAISIVGDLTVSMFKRTAGIKDSGTLFPGHGGVLDRIDSVAAAAPLFVLGLGRLGVAL